MPDNEKSIPVERTITVEVCGDDLYSVDGKWYGAAPKAKKALKQALPELFPPRRKKED